ncbi:MAG: hypothetical protein ACJAUT_000188 [Cellvibrionaceae bacterium]|jgi:uncharacterized protein (DUF1499 family)
MSKFMNNLVIWQAGLLLLLCLSVVGLRIELIPFKSFAGIFGLSTIASIALAVIVLFKFVTGSQSSLQYSALSLVFAIAIIGGIAFLLKQIAAVPRIHDISTNLVDIPQFTKAQALRHAGDNSLAFSDDVARQQKAAYPKLKTLLIASNINEAVKKSINIAQQLGWQIHFIDETRGLIEATYTSTLFGFIDDIVIRVHQVDVEAGVEGDVGAKAGVQIDLRSASRVGESDLGANAQRIKEFGVLLMR